MAFGHFSDSELIGAGADRIAAGLADMPLAEQDNLEAALMEEAWQEAEEDRADYMLDKNQNRSSAIYFLI